MKFRSIRGFGGAMALAAALWSAVDTVPAHAQEPIKIGVILTLSGPPGRAGNRQNRRARPQ